jgi:hypothetical protein
MARTITRQLITACKQYCLAAGATQGNIAYTQNVIGKGPERFAEKIKIRFSWLCSQTGKHRDFKIWRKYSRFQAPGSPYRLDINHEKKFYVSGLHKLCFENYIGGI